MLASHPIQCPTASFRLSLLGCVTTLAAAVTLLSVGAVAAQTRDRETLRQAVEKYLESGATPKEGEEPVSDEVIRKYEHDLGDAARLHPDVVFARMYVAARRGDFRSANKRFNDLPRDYQRKLLVRQTKIWTSIRTEDDISAQLEMIYLGGQAKKQGDEGGSRQAADFAGRMYGYLTGPLGRPQKELEPGVLRRLDPEYKPLYEAGRQQVTDRFAAIKVKLDAAQEAAMAIEREQRERDIQTIVAQVADLEKQLKPMLASLQKAESDLARELQVDEDQLRLLSRQMADLEEETALLGKQIKSLKIRIKELRAAAAVESDPTEKQLLLSRATRFEVDLRRLETKLSKQDTRLVSLVNKTRAVRATIDERKATLDPQRKAVQESTSRFGKLRAQENDLRKAPILGLSPEVVALQTKAQAIETYLPEFWSTIKASILGSFD